MANNKMLELRSIIYGEYKSEAELARYLNWFPQRLNLITNGIREPNIQEINDLTKALEITVEELIDIFLRHKSPNGQLSK